MTTTPADKGMQEPAGRAMGRRGLVAGAAALAVAMTLKEAAPVAAGGTQGNALILGADGGGGGSVNTAMLRTLLEPATGFGGASVFEVFAGGAPTTTTTDGMRGKGQGGGAGVVGVGSPGNPSGTSSPGAGVVGVASGSNLPAPGTVNAGVYGTSKGVSTSAVFGEADLGYGVGGLSGYVGVGAIGGLFGVSGISGGVGGDALNPSAGVVGGNQGTHTYDCGVRGQATGSGVGVRGDSDSGDGVSGTSMSGIGVMGTTATGPYAVAGHASKNVGVYGLSDGGTYPYGVLGQNTAPGGFSLFGNASAAGSVAFGGTAYGTAVAGQFIGPVNVYGQITLLQQTQPPVGTVNAFIVGPGVTKNAAVELPDGTHGLMHCVEAPEPWFEDFGEGTLAGGKAEVKLDAEFLHTVDTAKLLVFCMPHGDGHHLNLAGRTAAGFTVGAEPSAAGVAQGRKASDLNGTFTWRVVAKRRDVKGDRLMRVELPKPIEAKLPPIPKLPDAPPLPPMPKPPKL